MNNKNKILKTLKRIWFVCAISFIFWLFYSAQSHGVSKSFLESNHKITVKDNGDYFLFDPQQTTDKVFVFYPGAMVDPKAYVPLCRKISENGIKVYLIKMPWRLATNGYELPKQLGLLLDKNKTYILAGHSQGGKMAAQFVKENPNLIDKLILIGTTHPRDISLADSKIPILKIYGSNDGIADERTIFKNKSKLPATAKFVEIKGANHAQFGYYGFQLGDNSAEISREQQQAETLKIIMKFIN
ncbi:alpha/beta hydrolase [Flavobacterium sp. ANB]|uniref:alpha/beta hydrolase n=1 Tax=unclassified Flavobacterium TaxID=196869 RepID=UPI0012B86A45|nr:MULTISPECIES: alpha/beta hydrolase [unclassified Flavobacterium]MBF4516029.1 alpha/beta hydrolase [Flavobacterium sp. ANB]MTD69031.1 alpha/beta hydrolase [Flavobacterium sp. LC2016-13]